MYDRWGLPNAGGVNDQPYGVLERSSILLNVSRAFSGMASAKAGTLTEWATSNPGAWRAIEAVYQINGEPF